MSFSVRVDRTRDADAGARTERRHPLNRARRRERSPIVAGVKSRPRLVGRRSRARHEAGALSELDGVRLCGGPRVCCRVLDVRLDGGTADAELIADRSKRPIRGEEDRTRVSSASRKPSYGTLSCGCSAAW